MKILLVDDDAVTRLTLAGLLESMGEVYVARDGHEAWRMLRGGERFDLVCSDVRMPGDGISLLERVRADLALAELPFVLITAVDDSSIVTAAARHGISGYLLKPFTAGSVRSTVARVLRAAQGRSAQSAPRVRSRAANAPALFSALEREAQALMEASALGRDEICSGLLRLQSACVELGLKDAAGQLGQASLADDAAARESVLKAVLAGAREIAGPPAVAEPSSDAPEPSPVAPEAGAVSQEQAA